MNNIQEFDRDQAEQPITPEKILANLERDYAKGLSWLNLARLLEFSPEKNQQGVRDSEGNFYPVPTFAEIEELYRRNKYLVNAKWATGFSRLLMTPMALPLPNLIRRVENAFQRRAQQRNIHIIDEGSRRAISLPQEFAIRDAYGFTNKGSLIYFPKSYNAPTATDVFDNGVEGFTKEEVIEQTQSGPTPGWSILLIKDVFPSPPNQQSLSDYLRVNQKPIDYLRQTYQSLESGLTIEDFLVYFLLFEVFERGEIISDFYSGSGVCCIANYYPRNSGVPALGWLHTRHSLFVESVPPGSGDLDIGVRSAIRLK